MWKILKRKVRIESPKERREREFMEVVIFFLNEFKGMGDIGSTDWTDVKGDSGTTSDNVRGESMPESGNWLDLIKDKP